MKKFKTHLKIKFRKILSFVLSTVLVAGVINMPFSAVAAEEEPTGRTFSFVGNSTSMSDNSIYVFPGDTLVCEASGERNTLLSVKFKTIVPEAANYTEIGKTDQFSIEYARNTSMEYDSYIYILSREDEPFLDTDLNYVWNITLDAYPGFQIIYHDKDDKAINEWGSHFYFLALNEGEEVGVSSESSSDFDISPDYDEDLGGQIGWSTTTGYIDRDNNDGGLYISAEEGPAYLLDEELFDAGMSKESNGVLNLYPVFYYMPSTLSVSIEDYVEGEDLSVSVETNRTDDYTIEFAKANGDGTYTTLSAAPTEPGDYRATVSFPETETQLVEGEYGMEVVKRGFTAISASDEYSIIQKAELTKIPSANELTYNGEAQALVTAGEAEGGEIVYSISKDGTYATDIPTGKEAGTYEVWYILKDSRDVYVSDPESLEITVAPKTVGITWSDTSFTYDGEEHVPSAAATGVIEDDTCTINVTGGKTNAGTYTAKAESISNTNYILPDDTEVTYTISPAETVTVDEPSALTLTYNGENQSLIGAGEAKGGSFVYSLTEDGEYSSEIPAGKNAGDYTVWYMVKGDGNHADSDKSSVTVTISPKTAGIAWSDTSFTYDGEEHVPSAVVTDIYDGDTCEATVTGGASEAGSYTARVTAISNANYVLSGDTEVTYTISQSESAIVDEPSALTLTYNGENQLLVDAGVAAGGSFVYSLTEDGEYSSEIPAGKNAGDYTVWYMVKGDGNHADSEKDSVTVTISPKTAGIAWSDTSFTYDGEEHVPSAVVTDIYDGDTCEATVSEAETEAGSYTARVTAISNANYVLSGDTEITYTISQSESAIVDEPEGKTLTYNGENQSLIDAGVATGGSFVYSLTENGEYSSEIPAGKNAGDYTVWYMVKGDANHADSEKNSITVTISPKTAGITWSDTSFTYDGEEHVPSAAITDICGGDTCEATVSGRESEVGLYTARVTAISNTNYVLTDDTEVIYTIAKSGSAIVEEPSGKTLTYNGENQSLINAGEAEGGSLVYSLTEDGEYTSTIPAGKSAGEYTVWYMVKGDSNHADSDRDSVTVTINPKTIGITWSDTSFTFDGREHAPSAVATGLIEGDTCTVNVTGGQTEAGTYTATATGLSNSDYSLPESSEEIAIEYVINGNNEEDNEEEGKEEQEDPSEEEQKDDPADEEQKQEENPSEEEQKDDPTEEEQKQEDNPSEEEQKQEDNPSEEEQKQEDNPSGEEQKDDPAEEEQKQEDNPAEEEQKQEDNPSEEEQKQEDNPSGEEQKDDPAEEEQKQEENPTEEEKKDDSAGNEQKEEPDTAPKTEEDIKPAPNEPKTPVQPGYLDKNSRFPDGSYRRSDSSVNVSMQDFIYGEKMPAPIITSGTNDVSKAIISYYGKESDNVEVAVETPKEVGDYYVRVELPSNDNYHGCSSSADFSIRYLPVPNDAYAIDGKNGNDGWYKSAVEIKPAKGYEISLGNRDNFSSEPIKISDSLKGGSIYLRDAIKGGQSAAIYLGNILIDTKAPTVNIVSEEKICYGDKDGNISIKVSDENFSHVEVRGREISIKDEGEGIYSFSLTAGKKKENVDFSVYDLAGNKTESSVITAPGWSKDGVVVEGELYLEKGEKYTLPEGKWKINGDNTVYAGGSVFYAQNEGLYVFTKVE